VNRERHGYWSAYIADLQKRMLLADWEVILSRKPCEPDNNAEVDASTPRRRAFVYLSEDFDSFTRSVQRLCIVHELVHVHLAQLRIGAWRTLKIAYGNDKPEFV
jgi:hypothetical protein